MKIVKMVKDFNTYLDGDVLHRLKVGDEFSLQDGPAAKLVAQGHAVEIPARTAVKAQGGAPANKAQVNATENKGGSMLDAIRKKLTRKKK